MINTVLTQDRAVYHSEYGETASTIPIPVSIGISRLPRHPTCVKQRYRRRIFRLKLSCLISLIAFFSPCYFGLLVQSWHVPTCRLSSISVLARKYQLSNSCLINYSRLSFSSTSAEESNMGNKSNSDGKSKRHPQLEKDIAKRLSLIDDVAPSNATTSDSYQKIQKDLNPNRNVSKQYRTSASKEQKKQPFSKRKTYEPGPSKQLLGSGSLLPPPTKQSFTSKGTQSKNTNRSRNVAPSGKNSNRSTVQPSSSGTRRGTSSAVVKQPNFSNSVGMEKKTDTRSERGFGKPLQSATSTSRKASNSTPGREYTSLLPPYLSSDFPGSHEDSDTSDDDDFLSAGLSSWEQFLSSSNSPFKKLDTSSSLSQNENMDQDESLLEEALNEELSMQKQLPSIQDLFPPDLTLASTTASDPKAQSPPFSRISQKGPFRDLTNRPLEGVLPVTDLFYRSSQAQIGDDEHDDEELPFSAEQSDAITSDENKILVRKNLVQQPDSSVFQQGDDDQDGAALVGETSPSGKEFVHSSDKSVIEKNRKMIRRGMEMLVGGVPIQADPPQRSIQLVYKFPPKDGAGYDWASTISLNTRDFGPLLHTESISKVSDFERGLFCEFFCQAALKWDVCPKDLHKIVYGNRGKIVSPEDLIPLQSVSDVSVDEISSQEIRSTISFENMEYEAKQSDDDVTPMSRSSDSSPSLRIDREIVFEIGVTREELESGIDGLDGKDIFREVFCEAFQAVISRAIDTSSTKHLWEAVNVSIPNFILLETDDGYTSVTAEIYIDVTSGRDCADMQVDASNIEGLLSRALDDGGITLAIASAAADEVRWPEAVRNRVIEECLFQDDDGDESAERLHWTRTDGPVVPDSEIEQRIPSVISDDRSSLYKGGGTDGVFHDFSALNVKNAPYSGEIGLRLVDAVTERAKQRYPRVIAIGDVHGCIDELQDLLRQCDYRQGDLVVFLGDLVCKGPDSVSVVQMAREIGSIGVRGNHDFEVVRWHQAIKSGVDPPVFGSEHYHIASCLTKADMNWMYSLPWYISSKDLGALFVHAGFVSGIRLAKQNPRLMMNMRSILPDGTVTSKFFNNWPWARLWDGPQTVLFGHDADRGLQQYEHAIGLDTGCVYGGRLTACILPEKKLVSVSARREYFKYRRKHYD
jgi:Calcineurin-like phosphoesterase